MYDSNLIARIIMAGMAAFGVAYTLAFLSGPWNLAARLRTWVAVHYGANSWQDEGINCPVCLSFWLAIPAQLWACWYTLDWLIVAILATVGAVALTHKLWGSE